MAKKVRAEQVDLSQYYNKSESTPLIQGANITITESEEGVTISSSGGGGGSTAWGDITGKPATFAPSAHSHDEIDNATDLTSIAGYNGTVKQYLTHNASGVLRWENS